MIGAFMNVREVVQVGRVPRAVIYSSQGYMDVKGNLFWHGERKSEGRMVCILMVPRS